MPAIDQTGLYPSERRGGNDRRHLGPRTLLCSLYKTRRRRVRRAANTSDYYLDVMDFRVMVTAVAVVLLSCTDVVFTLALLRKGASEINPVMGYLLEIDVGLFVACKLMITGVGVLLLAAHDHFRVFRILRGRHALYGVLATYVVLIQYQLTMLSA
jgi:hypothetical protein